MILINSTAKRTWWAQDFHQSEIRWASCFAFCPFCAKHSRPPERGGQQSQEFVFKTNFCRMFQQNDIITIQSLDLSWNFIQVSSETPLATRCLAVPVKLHPQPASQDISQVKMGLAIFHKYVGPWYRWTSFFLQDQNQASAPNLPTRYVRVAAVQELVIYQGPPIDLHQDVAVANLHFHILIGMGVRIVSVVGLSCTESVF